MKNSTLGVMAIGQIAGKAVEDYVSPTVAGYIPAMVSTYASRTNVANVGLGVVGIVAIQKMRMKDDVKLAVAVASTRLLADAVYAMASAYLPAPSAPVLAMGRPMVRVASVANGYNGGGGLVTVD